MNKLEKLVKNIKNNNKIRYIFGSSIIAVILIILVLLILLKGSSNLSLELFKQKLFYALSCIGICSVFIVPFALIIYVQCLFFSSSSFKTWGHLMAKRLLDRRISKNSEIIFPFLQAFLYETIRRNNDILNLPLGKDFSSVNPNGYYIRNNCVFYHFTVISPEKPTYDNDLLRKILQEYIKAELKGFGISGLASIYQSSSTCCYSIFIDRLFYDEQNNVLSLEVLYIDNEESAKYWRNSLERDNSNKVERTVFDDEI